MTNPDTLRADPLADAQLNVGDAGAVAGRIAVSDGAILDAIPAQVAVLDGNGVILAVNHRWRQFATEHAPGIEASAGTNYVETCERIATAADHPAAKIAGGIRSVLRGDSDQFVLEFPCHAPGCRCWLRMMVTKLAAGGAGAAVISIFDVTDRNLVEQELRLNQQQFSNAFEFSAIGKAIVGIDGRLLKVNAAFATMLGYTVDEMLELDFQRLTHPDDLEVGLRGRQKVLTGELSSYHAEKRYLHREGHVVWAALTTSLVRDAEGRPLHTIAEIEDITGRRLAREELRRSAGELRRREEELARMNRALRMLTNCNEALIRAEDESQLLENLCRIAVEDGGYALAWVGFIADDELGTIVPRARAGLDDGYLDAIWLCASDRVPQGFGPAGTTARTGVLTVCEDLEASAAFHWRDEARARGYRGVIALPLREGERTFGVMVLYSIHPRPVPPDEETLLQELADDLAFGIATLRSRQRIREQASMLDEATDAIFVRDLDHRILFWSRGAERLYGWTAAEATGKDAFELIHIDARSAFDANVQRLMADGAWSGALRKVTRSGKTVEVEARWTLIRDEGGRPKSILAINTDVTERRRLEAQFLRAQRLESLGTLAGGIAHDLNNVLSPIVMGISYLKRVEHREKALAIIRNMEKSAQRGTDLVRQVLSFSRGAGGDRVPVKIAEVLGEIETIIRRTFPKDIMLDLHVAADLPAVVGDATQLHQVLLNLCVNARDAMPDGGHLTLTAERVEVDAQFAAMNGSTGVGPHVMLAVADEGSGMTRDLMERVFDPFFTTKPSGKGTGLGLSTVLGIVRSHGGFVSVYSEPGAGSTFRVYLPAVGETQSAHDVEKEVRVPRGRGELVLVVDDEPSILSVTSQTLEAFGYRTLSAADGAEAVAQYARHRAEIDAVVTDMMMPVMDGRALIAALQRIEPSVRIVGTSGLGGGDNVVRARQAGVSHFLTKPYTAEMLLAVLREALDAGSGKR